MIFEELKEFLENKMWLNHIYQPLLVETLVELGGYATIRQLAITFLAHDESQIRYYEKKLKKLTRDIEQCKNIDFNEEYKRYITDYKIAIEINNFDQNKSALTTPAILVPYLKYLDAYIMANDKTSASEHATEQYKAASSSLIKKEYILLVMVKCEVFSKRGLKSLI